MTFIDEDDKDQRQLAALAGYMAQTCAAIERPGVRAGLVELLVMPEGAFSREKIGNLYRHLQEILDEVQTRIDAEGHGQET